MRQLIAQKDPSDQVNVLGNWMLQWQQAKLPPDSVYINGLLHLGVVYLYRNELAAATKTVKQAVGLSQSRRPDVAADQPAKALYRLGMLLSVQNLPTIDILKQAVKSGQGIRAADRWVGHAYLYLAYAYYSAGDLQQGLNYVERGEQMAEQAKDRLLLIKLLDEKVKALNDLGQYVIARRTAERVVTLSVQDGYPTAVARSYQLLAAVAKNQEQLSEALQYAQRAFDIARANNDLSAPNYAVEVGMLYFKQQRYDQAIPYFQFGLDNNTNRYAKAYALIMLGEVYQHKKAYAKALQYYQHGLTTMPIGFLNLSVTSLPDAQSIRRADQKDYLLSLIQDKADTWLNYAQATGNNRQRLQHALATYKVADQMIDYMRWDHTAQESKLYWRQKTRGMYERAIETCYRLKDAEQAFRFFEKSRAVLLADKLNELGAQQQLSEDQIQQEKKLREAVSFQRTRLLELAPDSVAYKTVKEALTTSQDELDSFLKRLEASNPSYYRYKYDTTTTKLTDLQRHLADRNASFVTYFLGDSALYLLGVTNDKVTLHRQPVGGHARDMRLFMTLLSDPDAMNRTGNLAQFLALGNSLYRQLLAPLQPGEGAVIVSPDGSFVPFEALSFSASKPKYLVETYAFSYVYSARLMLRSNVPLSHKASFRGNVFLGVAPVTFTPSLKQVSLYGSDEALKPIADRFPSARLLTHKAATRRSFLDQAADAQIIHLFTHASADSSSDEPKLYFADSTLLLSNLSDGSLPNAQLVVLAACKTGVGANQRGEGIFSLARGFAALGAPSILTTLWSVENDATYKISNLFYKYLNQGMPKDIALQQAKHEWVETASGTNRLPSAWAGLIIIGDTQPLDHPNHWLWVASGLLLVGAAGVGLWWRQKRPARPAFPFTRTA
ncbi:CHAT domain-containing protein [Spirosoma soli]|uniref:CHAT domain-containing protein n=2 Tax=Spirosoma soli TaxID=1770529 RepID=A0ABW5LZQ3_9BACT